MESNRKMGFSTLVTNTVYMNRSMVDCYIKDTSYAWLKFNDCMTGRGYLMKLPFSKENDLSNYTSALNDFDPAFKIAVTNSKAAEFPVTLPPRQIIFILSSSTP